MPACRPSQLRPSAFSSTLRHDPKCSQTTALASISRSRKRRDASTAVAFAPKATLQDLASTFNAPVRTVLHKAESFVPRVLPTRADLPGPNTAEFWQDVLDGAYDRLNTASPDATARVVVYGADSYSGARELVTALLEEPFAPDARKNIVRERWNKGALDMERVITYGYASTATPTAIRIPSTWLQQFPIPVELHELSTGSVLSQKSAVTFKSLFNADVPIIVCNPATTPLTAVRSDLSLALRHANAILVVVCSTEDAPAFAETVAKQFPPSLSVVFAEPSRALNAIRTLSAEPGSSLAVQRYQDNYTASGLSKVTALVAEKLSVASSGAPALFAMTAREQIKAALSVCESTLNAARREVDAAVVANIGLRDRVAELEARIEGEVLGVDSANEVKRAVARAKQDVKVVMDRLTWWRCIWRVDDIGDTVKSAVDRAWCRELEDRLIFHSGRLAVAQESLAKASRAVLTSHKAGSALYSPVLENTLSQIQTSPAYPVTPAFLTSPVHARRRQLAYPTNMLHSTAQRVVLGMGTSVLTGFGTAWAGWAEKLGVLGGALGPGMELETAVGTGMFIGAAGVWWMVGKWEKAKRRWWKDWDRVGEGLERDLKAAIYRTVQEKVALIPISTCEGMNHVAETRREEIEALKDELAELEEETRLLLKHTS